MAYEKLKAENYDNFGGINIKTSPYIQGPHEFLNLTNVNFVTPGSLTQRPGSTFFAGATVQGKITGGVEFTRLSGASYIVVAANTNIYTVAPGLGFQAFKTGLTQNALFDYVTFVDRLFCTNGFEFFKFDGSQVYNYSLPPGVTGWGATQVVGGGLSGIFIVSYGYLNERGYLGPCSNHFTISLNGITFGSILYYGMTSPTGLGYGITAIQLYRSSAGGNEMFNTTLAPFAGTSFLDAGLTLGTVACNENLWFTLAPKYLELYNNQLFLAGFTNAPSTVYWSQIGEPEAIDPTFFNEFRTNDGDRITGLKFFSGSLVASKERSLHRVVGDNPNNFTFQEITDQYGNISNRAMVVFQDYLWMLDVKGIVQWDGANIEIISNKVEQYFRRMNLNSAKDQAVAIHYKQFNEVWFSFPIDSSTINNITIVYDYYAKAWTTYEGFKPSSVFIAKSTQDTPTVFYGGYTGAIHLFNGSLLSDFGIAFTCLVQSRFLHDMGQTVEKQFRRFYLNVEPVSVTSPITINFKTNYSTTTVLSRTMYQNPFQSRVDFGLPAKSISAEVQFSSGTLPFKIHGYTFESRYQRST